MYSLCTEYRVFRATKIFVGFILVASFANCKTGCLKKLHCFLFVAMLVFIQATPATVRASRQAASR